MSQLAEKILREGVHSLKVDMLPPLTRKRLLQDAGDRLLSQGALSKAADAYALGGCTERLREMARWLLDQRRYGEAALFLRTVGRPDELESLANDCIAAGDVGAAKLLYGQLGNAQMVAFLEENFRH